MAYTFQQLKYGWIALVGVAITGTTIYFTSNTRTEVQAIDIIELALGVTERCLATQYSTNPVSYYVSPPSFVRDWVKSNAVVFNSHGGGYQDPYIVCYTSYWPSTTGISTVHCYTSRCYSAGNRLDVNYAQSWTATGGHVFVTVTGGNSWAGYYWPTITVTDSNERVTNAIGWHIDRNMMVELDAKIKALVPYYCDTNTVYDGTTNIAMLSVTGLWASLHIGDGTNKFTSTPAWVGTNGVTNAATYGEYPWQVYKEDLEERYKVLNALKTVPAMMIFGGATNFDNVISRNATFYGNLETYYPWGTTPINSIYLGSNDTFNLVLQNFEASQGTGYRYITMGRSKAFYYTPKNSGRSGAISFATPTHTGVLHFEAEIVFNASLDYFRIWNCVYVPDLLNHQTINNSCSYTPSSVSCSADYQNLDSGINGFEFFATIDFPFQYCTNKYW